MRKESSGSDSLERASESELTARRSRSRSIPCLRWGERKAESGGAKKVMLHRGQKAVRDDECVNHSLLR